MNIYLISQDKNEGYDSFDSAVVVAENEEKAKLIHPCGNTDWDGIKNEYYDWAKAEYVSVELIGIATGNDVPRVICSSFNAG